MNKNLLFLMRNSQLCVIIIDKLLHHLEIIVEDYREMKISYKKLWIILAEKEMSKQEFRESLQLASGTMTKLNKGQEVSMSIILRICEYFKCNIGDICDAVEND